MTDKATTNTATGRLRICKAALLGSAAMVLVSAAAEAQYGQPQGYGVVDPFAGGPVPYSALQQGGAAPQPAYGQPYGQPAYGQAYGQPYGGGAVVGSGGSIMYDPSVLGGGYQPPYYANQGGVAAYAPPQQYGQGYAQPYGQQGAPGYPRGVYGQAGGLNVPGPVAPGSQLYIQPGVPAPGNAQAQLSYGTAVLPATPPQVAQPQVVQPQVTQPVQTQTPQVASATPPAPPDLPPAPADVPAVPVIVERTDVPASADVTPPPAPPQAPSQDTAAADSDFVPPTIVDEPTTPPPTPALQPDPPAAPPDPPAIASATPPADPPPPPDPQITPPPPPPGTRDDDVVDVTPPPTPTPTPPPTETASGDDNLPPPPDPVVPDPPAQDPPAQDPPPPPPDVASVGGIAVSVAFPNGESELPQESLDELRGVAQQLLSDDSLRLTIRAYAAGTVDTASVARRLSLSRALAVRSYLIEQGVRGPRMDVRALGHRTEAPQDRVDLELVSQ